MILYVCSHAQQTFGKKKKKSSKTIKLREDEVPHDCHLISSGVFIVCALTGY